MTYSPNAATSRALTEVRTVLSRARTALDKFDRPGLEMPPGDNRFNEIAPHCGDDIEQMRAALEKVVALLEPWQRR